jgi:hypothetical protein
VDKAYDVTTTIRRLRGPTVSTTLLRLGASTVALGGGLPTEVTATVYFPSPISR